MSVCPRVYQIRQFQINNNDDSLLLQVKPQSVLSHHVCPDLPGRFFIHAHKDLKKGHWMHSSKKVFETKKKIKKTETCFLLSWSLKAWDYTIFMSTSLHAVCCYERYARHFCPLAFSSAVVSWVVDIYLNTNNQKNPMKHCSCSKIYLQIFLGSWNKYPLKIIIKSTKIKYLKYRAKLKKKQQEIYLGTWDWNHSQ